MMPLLVRVDNLDTQTSQQYAFLKSPVRMGRNPLNDLALDSAFVSQWHAVLQFDDHATQYFDLGSTNGTSVNGQRIGKNMPVPIHDASLEFRIGSLRLYFARAPAPPHLLSALADKKKFGQRSFMDGAGGNNNAEHTMMVHGPSSGEATAMFNPEATAAYDPSAAEQPGAPANPMAHIAQMRSAVTQLRPLYDAYRRSWNALFQGVGEVLRTLPPPAVKLAIGFLEREFPALGNEEQFRAYAQQNQVGLTGPNGVANAAGLLLTQFAQYFVPARKAPDNGADVEKMLVRVAALLDAFSTSFVALRKGYNQFGSEMALPHHRNPADITPLDSAADAREVVAYLLDWTADGNARVQELTSAYADIMIHQVALLNGLMEGVRSLLHRLGPTEIDREVASSPLKLGPISLPRILWPFRGGARWRRFVKRHRELTEEDREITSAVFGAEFARAYAGVVGENFTERGPKQLNDSNRR